MVVYTTNLDTWMAEAGGISVGLGPAWFQTSQGHIVRPCLKNK